MLRVTRYCLVSRANAVVAAVAAMGCSDGSLSPTAEDRPALATSASALVFEQVTAGEASSCGVTTSGRAYCWGFNDDGRLGDGTHERRLRPTAVAGDLVFRGLSAGGGHTCGVTIDHVVYCWGHNANGQLGDGTIQDRATPTPVAGNRKYRAVTAGEFHTCAISDPDDVLYCWGYNFEGMLGDGTRIDRHAPVAVVGVNVYRQVDAGLYHTCGVTAANRAFCWGTDDDGRLGDGDTRSSRTRPSLVAGGLAFDRIEAGILNTCGVTTTGKAYCWGAGPVGDGGSVARYTPRAVGPSLTFRRVSVQRVMCGISSVGKPYCWGKVEVGGNADGALGDGQLAPHTRLVPTAVVGNFTFAQLSVGNHVCARTSGGAAYCWGFNSSGQLGDGTTQSRARPTAVLPPI